MAKQQPIPVTRRGTDRANDRAKKVRDAAQAESFPLARMTRHGQVELANVAHKVGDDGLEYVEVYTAGATVSGDPHFKIWNPPVLVEDPVGEIELSGRRYREDPLGAIAEVVASAGGRQKGGRR